MKNVLRGEVTEKISKVEQEVAEMIRLVKEDMANENMTETDMFRIKERIKELEQHLIRIIE